MPTNTYQYIQYMPYVQDIQIHINTGQYMHISHVSTCQYIPILAMHTKNNTYQYIPQYIPCQYMPIHATKQTTIHANTYHEVQYLPIHTHNFTDDLHDDIAMTIATTFGM